MALPVDKRFLLCWCATGMVKVNDFGKVFVRPADRKDLPDPGFIYPFSEWLILSQINSYIRYKKIKQRRQP